MRHSTPQEKFWANDFGNDYVKRNYFEPKELDDFYIVQYGKSRTAINNEILGKLKFKNILEIGSNVGNQLKLLQKQGYKNLYGIEINQHAVELSKKMTTRVNIIQGSAFDLPFKDNYFDLAFTSGVLIHINPKDLKKIMNEIYRVTKKYIWGFEYFSPTLATINYRGNKNRLWKNDYAKTYLKALPDLKLIKEVHHKYLGSENVDSTFLLKKG